MAKFLTKKVALIALAVVVALGGVIWAIVANYTPKFRSGITDVPAVGTVSGNGTASVLVDDYLYFVGDSVRTESIEYGDNEYYPDGKIPDAGIFRVKIGADGKPVLTYEYNNTYKDPETGEKKEYQYNEETGEKDEKYNTVVETVVDWDNVGKKKKNNQDGYGIEVVVPKIAGHDNTAMWVFGKYLIYTSPHNRLDKYGNKLFDYIDFFRVDLDGKNHTKIYTTNSTDLTTKNFTVWAYDTNDINLLVYETNNQDDDPKTAIKKINVKTKKVTVLDTEVSNVVLPSATQYGKQNEALNQVYGGVMGYVYYTKARDNESLTQNIQGNLLYRCSIKNPEPEIIADDGNANRGTTFTPLAVTPRANGDAQFVFAVSVGSSTVTLIEKDLCVITNDHINDYKYTEPEINGEGLGLTASYAVEIYANDFCVIDGSLYHYTVEGSRVVLDRTNNSANVLNASVDAVLAVLGDTIYIQSGNSVIGYTKNGRRASIDTTPDVTTDEETDDDAEEEETAEYTITLPVAILYQPNSNGGESDFMIFVQDTNYIRVFYPDGSYRFVRIKAA